MGLKERRLCIVEQTNGEEAEGSNLKFRGCTQNLPYLK